MSRQDPRRIGVSASAYDMVCVSAERDQALDALRRILPMAEAWFHRELGGPCNHEPGECMCDRKEYARTDINIALTVLGMVKK